MELPKTGFVRLEQIIGNRKASPPIAGVIPVCAAAWWNGVKSGLYPKSVKLGPRSTAWAVEDIRDLVERIRTHGKPCEGV